MLAKQEINCLLETLQKQQHQFTELADHIQLDAGIPVTFTKVHTVPTPSVPALNPVTNGQEFGFVKDAFFGFRTTGSILVQRWRSAW